MSVVPGAVQEQFECVLKIRYNSVMSGQALMLMPVNTNE